MATSKQDIERWWNTGLGRDPQPTHMIVAYDTFDRDDYPVYVFPGEDCWAKAEEHERVMEVYAYHLPFKDQVNEPRAKHWESKPAEPEALKTSTSKPDTTIADIIRGAEIILVAADHCEEKSTPKVMKMAAEAAGDAYKRAFNLLEERGYAENAREVGRLAEACYRRAGKINKAEDISIRATRAFTRQRSSNIYD